VLCDFHVCRFVLFLFMNLDVFGLYIMTLFMEQTIHLIVYHSY
jgi:hypothetical protein